jgi:hypothetical protein
MFGRHDGHLAGLHVHQQHTVMQGVIVLQEMRKRQRDPRSRCRQEDNCTRQANGRRFLKHANQHLLGLALSSSYPLGKHLPATPSQH